MNDLEKFIDKLMNLNQNDELIINKNDFLNDSFVQFIISNYGFDKSTEDNLYIFACYLTKLNKKRLNKVKSKCIEAGMDLLVFGTLAVLDERKSIFFSAMFINYLNTNSIQYKELVMYIKAFSTLDMSRI